MMRVIRRQKGKWSSERGSVLVLSTLGMVAICLAVGLSVDMGHFYLVSAELQSAADAAALSAASALNSGPSGITLAVDRAVAAMNKYEFNKTNVTIERENVRFAINLSAFDNGGTGMSEATAHDDPAIAAKVRFVHVTVPPKAIKVYFAVSALGNSVNMTKRAVAGQSVGLNYFCNIAPLSVVQDDATGQPLTVDPGCPNQTEFTPGCTYTIRLPGGEAIEPGNYQPLDLDCGGGGGRDLAQSIARGINSCIASNNTVCSETGVKAGPVADGMNTRFDLYSGSVNGGWATYPPDTNVMGRNRNVELTYAQYTSGDPAYFQAPPNHPAYGVPDRRVIVVPVINQSEFSNGNTRNLHIASFGAFFVKEALDPNDKSGAIRVEYVGQRTVFGDGGYDPSIAPGTNQSLTVAVLYR